MNYLITGGTGLIGQGVIAQLRALNMGITVLTRDTAKAKKTLGANIHFINDLSTESFNNIDVVLNLLGEPIADKRWSTKQKNKICQSRWQVTQKLVDLIKQTENPPSTFISGSAIGIYGRQNKQPISEGFDDYYQEFTHEVCSKWENIALSATSNKTRVVVIRTGIVLAKNGGALSKMLLPFTLGLGGKLGDGKQIMSWIHYDDMIAAILHISKTKELQGAVNLTAPYSTTNEKFSKSLALQLNRPCIFTTPAWALKIILGEMSALLLYGQNVIPAKLVDSGYRFTYLTIEDTLADLLK
jgi:hypothetical protein